MSLPGLLTYYYPHVLAVIFLMILWITPVSEKAGFFFRALTALVLAIVLAHLNRWFDFYPSYRYFASGHMTFCTGVTLSLGLLRPRLLMVFVPLAAALGVALVLLHFHSLADVLGAVLIVALVYVPIHGWWRLPSDAWARPSTET